MQNLSHNIGGDLRSQLRMKAFNDSGLVLIHRVLKFTRAYPKTAVGVPFPSSTVKIQYQSSTTQ